MHQPAPSASSCASRAITTAALAIVYMYREGTSAAALQGKRLCRQRARRRRRAAPWPPHTGGWPRHHLVLAAQYTNCEKSRLMRPVPWGSKACRQSRGRGARSNPHHHAAEARGGCGGAAPPQNSPPAHPEYVARRLQEEAQHGVFWQPEAACGSTSCTGRRRRRCEGSRPRAGGRNPSSSTRQARLSNTPHHCGRGQTPGTAP